MDLWNWPNFRSIISVYWPAIIARNTVCDRKTSGVKKTLLKCFFLKTYFTIDSLQKLVHIL